MTDISICTSCSEFKKRIIKEKEKDYERDIKNIKESHDKEEEKL
jgi:hypothetical protein